MPLEFQVLLIKVFVVPYSQVILEVYSELEAFDRMRSKFS